MSADADQVELSIAEETDFGEDPEAGYEVLRMTQESLEQESNYENSVELRSDRQVADSRRMSLSVSGDVNFELSYGTFDALLAAALAGEWAGDELVNGTTFKSFSIQRHHKDIEEIALFLGMSIDQLQLQISNSEYITGQFGFQGLRQEFLTAANSATAANNNPVFTAAEDVDNLQVDGSDVEFLEWQLTLENNLRQRPLVASLVSDRFGMGKLAVSGSVQVYFKNKTIMEDYLNATFLEHKLALTDPDGNSYTITIPRLRYTSATHQAGGENQDIIAELDWQAMRDPTAEHTIKIVRAAAGS